uniref:Uncharacterized protein n=1 Tax=Daucus carota subsp. sativus TaxID=79200 RepID=A0A175YK97_DAUCS
MAKSLGAGSNGGNGGGKGRGGRGNGGAEGRGRGGGGRGHDIGEGRGRGVGEQRNINEEEMGDHRADMEADIDEEGNGDEGHEEQATQTQESRIVRRVTFERANRSCSVGDYHKKPARDEDRSIVHFLEGRKEAKKKKTLSYIIKVNWREDTHESKGLEREAFYDRCLRDFKEKKRAEQSAVYARRGGLKTATRHTFKPHYFSQRIWDNLNSYWGSDLFKKRSANAKKARAKVEHIHHSGAKPFSQRREELEEKKQGLVSDMEFLDHVYHFDDPASKKLRMHRLANEAFPDRDNPVEQELWTQYMQLATAFVVEALKLNDKVILEVGE